jgi:hypothetical protein
MSSIRRASVGFFVCEHRPYAPARLGLFIFIERILRLRGYPGRLYPLDSAG